MGKLISLIGRTLKSTNGETFRNLGQRTRYRLIEGSKKEFAKRSEHKSGVVAGAKAKKERWQPRGRGYLEGMAQQQNAVPETDK